MKFVLLLATVLATVAPVFSQLDCNIHCYLTDNVNQCEQNPGCKTIYCHSGISMCCNPDKPENCNYCYSTCFYNPNHYQ